MRRVMIWAVCMLLCLTAGAQAATAPYTTLTEDNEGNLITTLDGYAPSVVMTTFDGKVLKSAQDIFIDENDLLYIADTGNKRVVCATLDGEYLRTYGQGTLKKPTGVCVRNGKLYVADTSLKAIAVFDLETGEELNRYKKPEEPLYGDDVRFEPQKVQVNSAGVIYLISNGNPNGVAMLAEDGAFLGYFGANKTALGFGEILKRIFYTSEMLESLRQNVPNTPTNLTMDKYGLIFTATSGAAEDSVKKFNMAGENLLPPLTRLNTSLVDVAVGQEGTFYAISSLGYIYEYTEEGRLLFFFGGEDKTGNRDAMFGNLVSIAADSKGNIYVLDTNKNLVQGFKQTAYAKLLHHALELWREGLYAESMEPWQEVLRYNNLFDFAYAGLGKAYYKLADYEKSLEYFRLGDDKEGYSDSFWEVRAVALQNSMGGIIIGLVAFWLVMKLIRRTKPYKAFRAGLHRVGEIPVMRALRLVGRTPRNPAAAFEAVKADHAVSIRTATVLYVLLFVFFLLNKYASAFLFKTVPDGYYNIPMDIALFFGILALFIISLNLVCSTRQSEARMRDLYCGLPLALSPMFIFMPLMTILGYGLTYNEQFLMSFSSFIMIMGSVVLVIVMIREMQNYTYGETFRVVLLTLFVMMVLTLTMVVIVILLAQLFSFISTVIREGSYLVQM